eukprot:XP_027313776.1 DNA repair protein RAD51 homolog 2 isoform X10 [Anas platyrhynchos]
MLLLLVPECVQPCDRHWGVFVTVPHLRWEMGFVSYLNKEANLFLRHSPWARCSSVLPNAQEGCLLGVLAVGHTQRARKRQASEEAWTCWRQPSCSADAVSQEQSGAQKRESSRIPPQKRLGSMAAKKLRRAKLSQELCERLSRYQITTCQDFLCLSLLELMKVTGQSYRNVQKLLRQVSLACAPKMQTAYEMKVRRSVNPSSAFLSTTLHSLDKVLHGGVPCGSLTEITSPPGCGKTQFCIMMSVLATLPVSMGGLDGAVVYIDTESAFSAERLVEIAGNRFPTYFDSDEKLFCMTRSVHLYRELTCDSVLKRIKSLEEEIISKKVKLIIIDSVASVVRKEFDTKLQGNLAERSNFLARGASLLKYLAEEFSIPVILTNQITTSLSNGLAIPADLVSPADDLFLSEDPGCKIPCCSIFRFFLHR